MARVPTSAAAAPRCAMRGSPPMPRCSAPTAAWTRPWGRVITCSRSPTCGWERRRAAGWSSKRRAASACKPARRGWCSCGISLAGATDAYLTEMQERYADRFWIVAGPDSITPYLLPFAPTVTPSTATGCVCGERAPFPTEVQRDELKNDMLDLEITLLPENLYRNADTVLRASVQAARLQPRHERRRSGRIAGRRLVRGRGDVQGRRSRHAATRVRFLPRAQRGSAPTKP